MKISLHFSNKIFLALSSIGATGVLGASAFAAPPAVTSKIVAPKNEATARTVFEQMRKTYDSLNSFSMTTDSRIVADKETSERRAQFFFKVPNRFALIARVIAQGGAVDSRRVSNGLIMYCNDSREPRTYLALPMPPQSVGRAALMQYQVAGIITPLLAGVDQFAAPWGEPFASISLGKSQVLNGAQVQRIEIKLSKDGAQTLTYLIGAKDHLLRRARVTYGKQFSMTETYSDIKINPQISSEKFTFTPPPGAHQEAEEVYWNKDLKVGSTPPNFEATDLDGNAVSLETLKGKVVLLDFWATWCGPCREELPHVQAAYQKFHDQGFEIVGVSFDQSKEDLQKFIAAKKMTWPQIFDGKSFQSPINEKYQATGIPFSVLIGRDGNIAAINARTLFLEPAIEKALSEKALSQTAPAPTP